MTSQGIAHESLLPGVITLDDGGHVVQADLQAHLLLGASELASLEDLLREQLGEDLGKSPLAAREIAIAGRCIQLVEAFAAGARIVILNDRTALLAAEALREDARSFLSHDLRAPIATVISLAESGADGTFAANPEHFLRIGRQAKLALDRADDVLRLLQTRGIDPEHFEPVDLVRVIHEAAEECWILAHARRIAFEINDGVAGEAEALVMGNIDFLRRSLSCLIDNAIRYGKADAVIYIDLIATETVWTITVRDQGPGIAAEELPRLLQHPQRKGRGFGYGAGLAFVRLVAERHRAEATVSSVVGTGSSFSLHLPRLL